MPAAHGPEDDRPSLLLVEDEPELGPLIASLLEEAYDVTLAPDGEAGLTSALSGAFDVLVLDRRLPGRDGIEILRAVRASGDRTPALLLTALGAVQDKVEGLDAGADDYLTKPFDVDELMARLRAMLRAAAPRVDDGERLDIGTWQLFPLSRTLHSPYTGRTVLTVRENDLLRLLAASPRRVFSREEILEAVFDADDSPGTVDTYVHYIRRKAEPSVIETVRGLGYRVGQL